MRYTTHHYFIYSLLYVIRAAWQIFVQSFFSKKGYQKAKGGNSDLPSASIHVNWEDCIGCRKCERACPVGCISIRTRTATMREDLGITSDGRQKSEWVLEFDIDMAKCQLCELCIPPCPTKCISMSGDAINSVGNRDMMIYHFTPFTPEKAFQIAAGGNRSSMI